MRPTRRWRSSDRLPERFRYHIQITAYSLSAATYPQVIDVANKLLAKYPDDMHALSNLSLVALDSEDSEKSVEWCEALARVSPDAISDLFLVMAYESLGRYDKARTIIERALERDPNDEMAHVVLGLNYLVTRQFAEAQRESEKTTLLELSSGWAAVLKGDLALLRGDSAASEREYLASPGQAEADLRGIAGLRLGWLYLTQGRFEKARDQVRASTVEGTANSGLGRAELEAGRPDLAVKTFQSRLADPAVAYDPSAAMYARFGLGLSYLAAGDIKRAQKTLDELKALPEGVFVRPKNRWISSLSGALAATRGDGRTAVADLERAVSTLPYQRGIPRLWPDEHGCILDLLAHAYEVAGDLAKARETYEKITTLTTGRLAYGATYARAFYHLGLIAERQGDKARARENFTKFLDLWKDADTGLPEVADARKRLAQLGRG